jgi:glycopeptide antibiotics resistance protein
LQYIWAIGRSDVTDVILNTAGGAAGMLFFFLFNRIAGRHARVVVPLLGGLVTLVVLAVGAFFAGLAPGPLAGLLSALF